MELLKIHVIILFCCQRCINPIRTNGIFHKVTYNNSKIKSEWPIIYIEGSHVIISKKYCISSFEVFVLANSADPNEIPHHAAFHLGLHCLPKG